VLHQRVIDDGDPVLLLGHSVHSPSSLPSALILSSRAAASRRIRAEGFSI
jgi:hypothetical protein